MGHPGAGWWLRRAQRDRTAVFVAAYFGAFVALEWATAHLEQAHAIAAWHPVAGLTFTVLLLGGLRYLPATYAAALLSGLLIWHLGGLGLVLAVLAYTGLYGLGAWVLRHRLNFDASLARARDVALLVVVGLLVPTFVGVVGAASIVAGGSSLRLHFLFVMRGWTLSDALGVLLLAPFACLWVGRLRSSWRVIPKRPSLDLRSSLFVLASAALAPIFVWLGFDYGTRHGLHLSYLGFIPVLIVSLRYELAGATAAALVFGIGILVAAEHTVVAPLDTQLFILATAIASLAFSTIIRERERARASLHDTRMSLDALLRAAPVAVIAIDPEGVVSKWTPAAERLFGWSEQEVIGRRLPTVPADRRREFEGAPNALLQGGEAFETVWLQRDGTPLDVNVSTAPVRDADGNISGHLAFVTNITERKAAEMALSRRDAMLEAVSSASEGFLRSGQVMDEFDAFLADLGRAADVSRVWVFENHVDSEGRAVTSQRFEWASNHVEPQLDNPELANLSWDHEPQNSLREHFEHGLAAHVIPRELADLAVRAMLEEQGIHAMVAAPIFVAGTFWGFMGFDECRIDRTWLQAETDALRAAAGIVGAALEADHAARELTTSEQRFRTMADSAPVLIWMCDTNGDPVFVNRALVEFSGFDNGEPDVSNWSTVHPDDLSSLREKFDDALRSHTAYQTEHRAKAADGRYRWLLNRVEPRFESDGRFAGLTGIAIDITESKHAGEALRDSEARFRSAFDNAAVGMAIVGLDGRLLRVNAELEKLTGYAANELLTQRVTDVTHPDDIDENRDLVRGLIAGSRESFRQELRTLTKARGALWVLLNVSLLRDDEGAPVYFLAELQDINERKATEQERERLLEREREQVERLRDLDRAKDQFVATVSHELRTPLTNILGYLDILLESFGDGQEHDLLRVVQRNAHRLLRLVGDLLLIAQLNAGYLTLEPTRLRLDDLAREALENAAALAQERALTTELEATEVEVLADPVRIGQVIDNLISNAVKFTPRGGTVRIRAGRVEEHGFLEIEDTGIGIAEDDLPHLFQRFFRTQEAQRQAIQGTGLGLAIVKAIVDAHEGSVSVCSSPGVGATFRVVLPCRTDEAGAAAESERRAA